MSTLTLSVAAPAVAVAATALLLAGCSTDAGTSAGMTAAKRAGDSALSPRGAAGDRGDRTSALATIEVALVARGEAVEPDPHEDGLGFASGLRGGWNALAEVVLVALTVLGALLPFAVLAALAGLPAYLVLRARRRSPAPPAVPTTSA